MASTSVSSLQKNFKYDVFLSFRGEDTRKTFVDHLYRALVDKGITTYKDDEEIEKGERISEQLIRSIEESRFYIIVFSKNYASSSWCLDELVTIMKCQKMPEHTAYPIFYDVEPTEVRHQSGAVGEAFARHEQGSWSSALPLDRLCSIVASCCQGPSSGTVDLENEDDVGRWRNALKEAASIVGMELKNTSNGHEADFVQQIVEEVSQKLHLFNFTFDGKLVGMETRVKDVVSSLNLGIDDVHIIGIKGIGGGGKTTLARAVFDKISISFEGKSFVENVREGSKGGSGLKNLQKMVLQNVLNDKSIDITGVYEGQSLMKKRLCSRKVLLVLDDVDDTEQLEALAGELNWFKPGSRIIITTRDEQVLVAHRANFIHDVSLLSDEEAICLFSRHAFNRELPIKGYEDLSRNVVRYAAGLPLTIKVLGSHLCDRSEREWEDAIKRLETIPLKETLQKLELSYNGLERDQKEIFLDIACILKGETKKEAIRILESCGFCAQIGLRVLEQKSLISICISKENIYVVERLRLHDHVEEMGKNIVRRLHPDEPKRHSRLWINEEIEDVLVNESGTEETKCILLEYTDLDPALIMKGLKKMTKLKLLYIKNEYREYESDKSNEADEVSQYLPDTLQYLCWNGYPFSSLPKTFEANNLTNLEMVGSNISELWEGGEQKFFNKLKFLDLRYSKLRTFDLSVTPHLEELNLGGCHALVEFHLPDKCPNLKILTLCVSNKGNLNLGMTPHLEKLKLDACNVFELHMPVECLMLKDLKLKGCKVSNLNLELIPHLEILRIKDCYSLQKIHAPVGCLKKVVECTLPRCSNFKWFNFKKGHKSTYMDSVATCSVDAQMVTKCPLHPKNNLPDFGFVCVFEEPGSSLSGYFEKIISDPCACKSLEYLLATICGLQHLRELTLRGSIPGDPWQLKSLGKLTLVDLKSEIKHLPDSICMLRHLKSLELCGCQGIEQLPENICRLEFLEELEIMCCFSLRDIPNNICKLKCLKRLRLLVCDQVEKLPEELGCLECLERLSILGCTSLRDIPNSICKLKCLKELLLKGCNQVEKLPEEFGCLECLEELDINGAGISRLPQSIYQLKGLRIDGRKEQLESYGFTSVVSFCDEFSYVLIE